MKEERNGEEMEGSIMKPEMAPEMEALKARLKATWMAGD